MSEDDTFYPYSFEAEIEKFGVGKTRKIWYNVLFLPDELRAELPFSEFPKLRVEGEIADVPIANAFIPAGDGRNYVIVAPNVMEDGGVALGDFVEMRFRIADQNHVDIPELLSAALDEDAAAKDAWENLTPGKQRMVAQHIFSAKTEKTRSKRTTEAVEAVLNFGGDLRAWRRSSAS